MELTLEKLRDACAAIAAIAKVELPVRVSFQLARFHRLASGDLQTLEEKRIELVKKYGKQDAKGNYSVPDDQVAAFTADFNQLLQAKVNIDFQPIALEVLDGCKLPVSFFATCEELLSV